MAPCPQATAAARGREGGSPHTAVRTGAVARPTDSRGLTQFAGARSRDDCRGMAATCLPLDPTATQLLVASPPAATALTAPLTFRRDTAMLGGEQGSGRWQISGTWTWPGQLSEPTDSAVVAELLDRSRSETQR